MKIFDSRQIREIDGLSIKKESIKSIDLMERASKKVTDKILEYYKNKCSFVLFCGMGNNGGDGLAIARMLKKFHTVKVYILTHKSRETDDFTINLQRLIKSDVHPIFLEQTFPQIEIPNDAIIIDAILGSGLNKPLYGLTKEVVHHINSLNNFTISIDINTGMFAFDNSQNDCSTIIHSDLTLSFQFPKLSFLLPKTGKLIKDFEIINIGLDTEVIRSEKTSFFYFGKKEVQKMYRPKNKFSHKGANGHALLIGGSYGKMGAMILSASGVLRSGVGLLSLFTPNCGYDILQLSVPEAMVISDKNQNEISNIDTDFSIYKSVGLGIGLGTSEASVEAIKAFFSNPISSPIVVDADALNIVSQYKIKLPPHTIITPHLKEFERFAGKTKDDFERLCTQQKVSQEKQIYIILKGAYTSISTPTGEIYFSSIACSGLATGGSGDVLTGIITSLLAQGYNPKNASMLGVYIHGRAGQLASKVMSAEAMLAGDIPKFLGKIFLELQAK